MRVSPASAPLRERLTGEQQLAVSAINTTRSMFEKLGVGARDGNDASMRVMFKPSFANAAYVPSADAIVIGSAKDGESYARANDVIAHEYSHRVMDSMLGLGSTGESGTLNESLADTFAAVVDNDWTVGEDVQPGGMRSMIDPSNEKFAIHSGGRVLLRPDHIDNWIDTDADSGGVHLNVGVPNKAAALIGEALGRQTMGQIYIDAVRNYLRPDSGIVDAAEATLRVASDRWGTRSKEFTAVADAWRAVGIQ